MSKIKLQAKLATYNYKMAYLHKKEAAALAPRGTHSAISLTHTLFLLRSFSVKQRSSAEASFNKTRVGASCGQR